MNKFKNAENRLKIEQKQYYENKGKVVHDVYVLRNGNIDKDGFQKFQVTVSVEDGFYQFDQYVKID